ncbi:SIS domain-containing protein [Flexivirga sp. ID2601S]|uniref:SIS domain-containing protein n=2 Tax=Flexivirga aerilata TaxID=1656889 RepID=A0A849AMN7_9MICO|nr:SIS domain-containing protein [Flexivirga aerilata]
MTSSWLDDHVDDLRNGMDSLVRQQHQVAAWGAALAAHLASGGRLLTAGNGGSAAEAQHLTAEVVGKFDRDRRPFSGICLSAESSSFTAILNDYGADQVFARQVAGHGRVDDVLVLMSTSGRSANVVRAARAGRDLGLRVWALTGRTPNPLARAADEVVSVDATSTAAVQEVHLVALHAICAALDQALQGAAPREAAGMIVG